MQATAVLAVAAGLGLSACGGSDTTRHLDAFQTPDHNVACIAAGGEVRCDVQNRSWSPPARPASCSDQVDFGQGVEVGSGPARFVCAGDTALNPSAAVLADGAATASGDITCETSGGGITCTNEATGHGFSLSNSKYRLF